METEDAAITMSPSYDSRRFSAKALLGASGLAHPKRVGYDKHTNRGIGRD
jgi:hypothetical protein